MRIGYNCRPSIGSDGNLPIMSVFSRGTIIALTEAMGLDYFSSSELDGFGFEFYVPDFYVGQNKPTKLLAIRKQLYSNPKPDGYSGDGLDFDAFAKFLRAQKEKTGRYPGATVDFKTEFPELVRRLEIDGFIIQDFELMRLTPSIAGGEQHRNQLQFLLDRHNFNTPSGHLDQAMTSFARGDWASTNGQLRTYVESLLVEFATRLGATNVSTGTPAIDYLATMPAPFLLGALNEWVGNGTGFVQGFWKRLHPSGPHPGLSDENDCMMRVQIVFAVTLNLLRRFDDLP